MSTLYLYYHQIALLIWIYFSTIRDNLLVPWAILSCWKNMQWYVTLNEFRHSDTENLFGIQIKIQSGTPLRICSHSEWNSRWCFNQILWVFKGIQFIIGNKSLHKIQELVRFSFYFENVWINVNFIKVDFTASTHNEFYKFNS